MTAENPTGQLTAIVTSIAKQPPFRALEPDQQNLLFDDAVVLRCSPGQRILRPDTMPHRVFVVLSGTIRLLAKTPQGSRTLDRRGKGQLIGWVSLLRAEPCEWVLASEETTLLGISAKNFVACVESNPQFCQSFAELTNLHEIDAVLQQLSNADSQLKEGWQKTLNSLTVTMNLGGLTLVLFYASRRLRQVSSGC